MNATRYWPVYIWSKTSKDVFNVQKDSQTERAEQKDALKAKLPIPAPWDVPPALAVWQLWNTSLSLSKYKEEKKIIQRFLSKKPLDRCNHNGTKHSYK